MRNRALKRLEAKLNKKPFVPQPNPSESEFTDALGNNRPVTLGSEKSAVHEQIIGNRQRITAAELAAMRAADEAEQKVEVPPGTEPTPCPGEDNRDCGKPAPIESIGVNDGE